MADQNNNGLIFYVNGKKVLVLLMHNQRNSQNFWSCVYC